VPEDVGDQVSQFPGVLSDSLPQRRHEDDVGTEPVVKVVPKLAVLQAFVQRALPARSKAV